MFSRAKCTKKGEYMKKLSVIFRILMNISVLIFVSSGLYGGDQKPNGISNASTVTSVNPVRVGQDVTVINLNSRPKQQETSSSNVVTNQQPESERVKPITARFENKICVAEKKVRALRVQMAHDVLQEFVEKDFLQEETPVIGIACSGGGLRASIATLGLLQGLEKINLLDGVTYLATLSGSTWTAASWILKEYSLDDLELFFRRRFYKAFDPKKLKIDEIIESVWQKFSSGRILSLNDFWGGILGNVFLKTPEDPSGQHSFLSELAATVNSGNYPIPVFTSIIANESVPYPWMEYTPYEVGSTY